MPQKSKLYLDQISIDKLVLTCWFDSLFLSRFLVLMGSITWKKDKQWFLFLSLLSVFVLLKGDYVQENLEAFCNEINIRQILIGLTVLFLGTLIYIIDRPPDQTYFVYKSFVNISLHNTLPNLFGFIGNSLPSFVHVFCFILLTAGFLQCQKRGCIIICASWFLIDFIFELGQKFKSFSSTMVPDWFSGIPFLENSKNYFLTGTFDFNDLTAIVFGTLSAYLILSITMKRKES